jgi:hypothetical protein
MNIKTAPITEEFGTTLFCTADVDICDLDRDKVIDSFKSSSLLLLEALTLILKNLKHLQNYSVITLFPMWGVLIVEK